MKTMKEFKPLQKIKNIQTVVETRYAKAWNDYKQSADYLRSENVMLKTMKQPYIDNILRFAFDAGWNNRPTE